MTMSERAAVAKLLHTRRHELGLSGRELARHAGIDHANITLLEQCKIAQPKFETLRALAEALDIAVADFFAAANWLPTGDLPSLRPYMRAQYEHLPESAVAEVEAFIHQLSQRYPHGPLDGEDEAN